MHCAQLATQSARDSSGTAHGAPPIELLPTGAQTLLLRLRRIKGRRSETEEVRPRQTPLLEIQRVLSSCDGVERSHGVRADCELINIDAEFDQCLMQRGPCVQSLVKYRRAEFHTRLGWRRHTQQHHEQREKSLTARPA